jgi:hypothetical protein
MYFKIPEQQKSEIEFLVTTDDETINVITSALLDLPPSIDIAYKIADRIVQAQKLDRQTALNIVVTLISLRRFYKEENFSNEVFVNLISTSIKQDIEFSEEQIESFKKRLSNLLKALEGIAFSLDIAEKASDLLIEHERIFSDSKIVTDIRPIFDSETEKKVEAAILIHTLKIQYKDSEATKEFYVALDSDDLDNLYEQIVIAIGNRDALAAVLRKAEIECINPITQIGVLDNLEDKDKQ